MENKVALVLRDLDYYQYPASIPSSYVEMWRMSDFGLNSEACARYSYAIAGSPAS